jgi:hypothetical protein
MAGYTCNALAYTRARTRVCDAELLQKKRRWACQGGEQGCSRGRKAGGRASIRRKKEGAKRRVSHMILGPPAVTFFPSRVSEAPAPAHEPAHAMALSMLAVTVMVVVVVMATATADDQHAA